MSPALSNIQASDIHLADTVSSVCTITNLIQRLATASEVPDQFSLYESLIPIQDQTTYHNYLDRIDIVVIQVRDRKTRCLKLDANMETGHEGIVNHAPHRGMAPERALVEVLLADFAKRPPRDHENGIHRNDDGSTSLMKHWQIL